jgi:hypothetical protein
MTSLSKKGSRVKGNRFELDVAKDLKTLGFDAERALLSGIRGEGDVLGLPWHVECKRCETLQISKWFRDEQKKSLDRPFVLVYRKSREKAKVVMDLEDFIKILREAQGKVL